MNNVELRWVAERISPSHKSMTLQYRVYKDHGGPYPNYHWSEWMTVPTIDAEKNNQCYCYNCSDSNTRMTRMILCPECGNKRCPKATVHNNACTNSNESGQKGSRY